jgi:predicted RNA binding protein YcfA (HicA-like mRNA interferase family)
MSSEACNRPQREQIRLKKSKAVKQVNRWRESRTDVRFNDLLQVAMAFGFEFKGMKGSHVVYSRRDLGEILTLQSVNGKAKPYQVKQLIDLIDRYNLTEDEPDV